MDLTEYTQGANLVLSGMDEKPATEDEMRAFWEAEYPADTAAEDFAYYRSANA